MIDIIPQLCVSIVSKHGVEALCERLKDVESIEAIESVIKALDKVSEEVPQAVVMGRGLESLSKLLEFFEFPKQVLIF